jgi:hypothetical protein
MRTFLTLPLMVYSLLTLYQSFSVRRRLHLQGELQQKRRGVRMWLERSTVEWESVNV